MRKIPMYLVVMLLPVSMVWPRGLGYSGGGSGGGGWSGGGGGNSSGGGGGSWSGGGGGSDRGGSGVGSWGNENNGGGGSVRTFSGGRGNWGGGVSGSTRTYRGGNARSYNGRSNGGSWNSGRVYGRSYTPGGIYHGFNRAPGNNGAVHALHHFNHSGPNPGDTQTSYGVSNGLHHFNHPVGNLSAGNRGSLTGRSVLPGSLRHSAPSVSSQSLASHGFSGSFVPPRAMSSRVVTNRMASFAGNKGFMNRVGAFNRTETMNNRSYWHNWNGNSYCHYRDGWGCNWYGWGCGAGFFWAQYYADNWWWQDPWTDNWCYWNDGNWCWQNPVNTTVYIYENGDYVPSGNNGYSQQPDSADNSVPSGYSDNGNAQGQASNDANDTYSQLPPAAGDNNSDSGMSDGGAVQTQSGNNQANTGRTMKFQSPDGTRTVKVTEDGDAFLFDTGDSSHPAKPLYLSSKVVGVEFTGDKGSLKIQLIHKDGTNDSFNRDGTPLEGENA